ncbi:hypothetical protein [Streptomyces virginiae]|uniref:hypothetical protein n=1 Tax=Streptomyces virginiae TaxID=1961 RepID=UPI002DB59C76|nr:hypothetical protein [Streptomyces sp. CMAA1738]MEC4576482.1 hypothetical protein [Streptomyces sp. CMAA1738]
MHWSDLAQAAAGLLALASAVVELTAVITRRRRPEHADGPAAQERRAADEAEGNGPVR